MIPDIRKNVPYTPPLPQWLKWVYFGSVAMTIGSVAYFGLTWKNSNKRRAIVEQKIVEMAKANDEIRAHEQKYNGLEASRRISASREDWKQTRVPSVALQAAVQLAVIEAEAQVIKFAEETSKAEAKASRRKVSRPPTTKNIPDVLIKSIALEVRKETSTPEVRIDLTHNTDSRVLVTQLHAALTKFKPDGYELQNFRPEERQNSLSITTSWVKQ